MLCIDYLNLPALIEQPSKEMVLNGDYVFMDYAVLYWVRHLEAGLVWADGDRPLLQELAESLETFFDYHWMSPKAKFIISKRNSERLSFFKDYPFYAKLEKATVSARKQLTFFGVMNKDEIALDLAEIVVNVRKVLESLISPSLNSMGKDLALEYGNNLFKCPRFSCKFFSTGFITLEERERHVEKHERPFQCPKTTCPGFTFGFISESEREKHMKDMHPVQDIGDQDFPTDEEIAESLRVQTSQIQELAQEPAAVVVQDPELEFEPQSVSTQRRSRQRQRNHAFTCEYCSKVFTKKYNWTSHLKTHSDDRPFKCHICGISFARENDHNRHKATHSEKSYKCGGILKDGSIWGCGNSFSRADILSSHHKSKKGQLCISPFLQEQQQT